MKETLIVSLVECIPQIVAVILTVVSAVVCKKIVPYINAKLEKENIQITSEQLADIKEWIDILVNSAYRLDKSGKLQNITKKEYVTDKIEEYIKQTGYNFTAEQLDDIRRAAVVALEKTESMLEDISQDIVDGVVK